jgi:hypothetical protein
VTVSVTILADDSDPPPWRTDAFPCSTATHAAILALQQTRRIMMRRSLWSLALCVGVCAAALIAARTVEAERPSDELRPATTVCVSDVAADDDAGAACGKCGDGYCNPRCGETATSCPKDCGATLADEAMCGKCGDGYCNPRCGETATSCPRDCAATIEEEAACGKCGDGYCNPRCGETATSCPKDCGGTTS